MPQVNSRAGRPLPRPHRAHQSPPTRPVPLARPDIPDCGQLWTGLWTETQRTLLEPQLRACTLREGQRTLAQLSAWATNGVTTLWTHHHDHATEAAPLPSLGCSPARPPLSPPHSDTDDAYPPRSPSGVGHSPHHTPPRRTVPLSPLHGAPRPPAEPPPRLGAHRPPVLALPRNSNSWPTAVPHHTLPRPTPGSPAWTRHLDVDNG